MGFSVLMSVYKREKPEYLKEALDSVVQQTLPPDEIVLIEDGPLTDKLYEVIEQFKEDFPILRTYQFEKNVQLGRALAKGVELCKYELIARMDTDDIAVKSRFKVQYTFMKLHPEIAVCGSYIEEFSEESDYKKVKVMPQSMGEIRKYARYRNPLNHMTVMFRKNAVIEVGNYRHFPFLEDYDLWVRMMASGKRFHNIPEVCISARISDELYKRRGGWKYFKQYTKLRKEQHSFQLTGILEYFVGTILSFGMTMQPQWIRKKTYQRILRK